MGGDELSQEARNTVTKQSSSLTGQWNSLGTALDVATVASARIDNDKTIPETSTLLETVVTALTQKIVHSIDLQSRNQRISSEAENQPKPADSFLDDFAVFSIYRVQTRALAVWRLDRQ